MSKTDNFLSFAVLSVAAHFVVLWFVFSASAKPAPVFVPVEVSFFSPLRGGGDTSTVQAEAPKPAELLGQVAPAPAQVPKTQVSKAEPIKVKDTVKIKKEVKPAVKEDAANAVEQPPVQSVPPAAGAGVADTSVAGTSTDGTGGAATGGEATSSEGGISLDNANFKYSYYTSALVRRIRQNWQFVETYGRLRALVYFRIERNGTVSDVSIAESSGSASFDTGAMRAVKISSPFPPLPDSFEDTYLGVRLEFKQPS